MSNPGKPDAYEEVLALLAIHPIKTWACAKAGISRASFYAKLDRDPEYAELTERAMADGQAPLAAVRGKSPERVLALAGYRELDRHRHSEPISASSWQGGGRSTSC